MGGTGPRDPHSKKLCFSVKRWDYSYFERLINEEEPDGNS